MVSTIEKRARTTDDGPPSDARLALERSLYRRMRGLIKTSISTLNFDELMRAVEAETPAETVVQVISAAPDAGLSVESGWTRAMARGVAHKQRILQRVGGCLTSTQVAELLEISVQAVKQRLARKTLLAVPLSASRWGFPVRQFDERGVPRDGLVPVLKAAGDQDPWVVLSILADPVGEDGDATIMERLANESIRRTVIARIQSFGEQTAS